MGIDLEETFETIVQNHASSLVVGEVHLSQEDVVLTALSSGTTGTPKCVQLTHANFNAATDALKRLSIGIPSVQFLFSQIILKKRKKRLQLFRSAAVRFLLSNTVLKQNTFT